MRWRGRYCSRDSRAIAEAAQGYGGSVGANAGFDGITVFGNALASNAGPMLNLLADVAYHAVDPRLRKR